LLFATGIYAQKFTVKAPSIVAVNSKFQIVYTVENAKVESLMPPLFSDFTVIAGPAQSFSSYNVNGNVTESVSFTYFVQATKEGIFEIPAAEVKLPDGTSMKSEKISIEVIKDAPKSGTQTNIQSGDISADDLFLKMEFNRQSIYKGEPVILTIKLYSHDVPVTAVRSFKMPTLAGFDTQQLQVPANESTFRQQKYNNRIYNVVVLGRLMLYPLRAGEIRLDQAEADVKIQIQQQSRSNDIFDMFMGPSYKTITKILKSPTVLLNIKDFPAGAPTSFNGATGNFTMNAKIDKTSGMANQPISYSITIAGTGNFKQVNEPLVVFPDKFDKYDPKVKDNTSPSNAGNSGSKKFDYVIIPRSAGEFDIPPVTFSYFDTQKGAYVTLKSDPIHLSIEKDPNSANHQPITSQPLVTGKRVEHLGNDILFIQTGALTLKPIGYVFFGSARFWLLLTVIIVCFVIACFVLRKVTKNRQNTALMRNKKANKVAVNRLKQSAKYLKANNRTAFYEEVSKAVWGYLGDKLNMQSSELSRDNVQEKLSAQNVPQEIIDSLIAVIDNCEYARYAPGSNREGMEEAYNEAVKAISKLENLF
jgi:hypothetical protein